MTAEFRLSTIGILGLSAEPRV